MPEDVQCDLRAGYSCSAGSFGYPGVTLGAGDIEMAAARAGSAGRIRALAGA